MPPLGDRCTFPRMPQTATQINARLTALYAAYDQIIDGAVEFVSVEEISTRPLGLDQVRHHIQHWESKLAVANGTSQRGFRVARFRRPS